ncbi:MAG: 5'-nucleotidase SurE [Alphaproteobacteria bacterium MarineAlpha4_Bin2]|nr:MAG: 5'-nucleotidase SurE [Alphaproteobacteria bacterium MarineAlpha4_Bin2]
MPLNLSEARILVVNDDGIRAPGIKVLERIANSFSKDVWVFAPEEEKSGAGHSISLGQAIRVTKVGPRHFAVGGSPTDCVMLALGDYLSDRIPDLVLSGINRGGNLGDDVTYSGTVSGALEATLLGIPAIALSQVVDKKNVQFRTAEAHVGFVFEKLLTLNWPRGVFMNVNFPNVAAEAVNGISIVPQGRRKSGYNLQKMNNPRREGYFHIIGEAIQGEYITEGDTDYLAIERGEISITPLHCDLTHYGALKKMQRKFK